MVDLAIPIRSCSRRTKTAKILSRRVSGASPSRRSQPVAIVFGFKRRRRKALAASFSFAKPLSKTLKIEPRAPRHKTETVPRLRRGQIQYVFYQRLALFASGSRPRFPAAARDGRPRDGALVRLKTLASSRGRPRVDISAVIEKK
jgi:hypothetical protein